MSVRDSRRRGLRATTVQISDDPVRFKAAVFPFLQNDPVLHSVLLSNIHDRAEGLRTDPAPPVLVSVHDETHAVVGAAMQTAGRGIFLGGLTDDCVPAVAEAYADLAPDADLVEGTTTAARLFADRWAARLGTAYRAVRETRLHRLGDLVEQEPPRGVARRATEADYDLAVDWVTAFGEEVGMPSPQAENEEWTRARLNLGRLWVWEVSGRPVSLVGHQDTVFGSTRVGPVYTPPEERRRGYGSALTAHVSRYLRDQGSAVCLYTDLANPTSNAIYAAIGYEPVTDFVRYELSRARSSRPQ